MRRWKEKERGRRDGESNGNGNKPHRIDSEAKQNFEKDDDTKHSAMREKYLRTIARIKKNQIKPPCFTSNPKANQLFHRYRTTIVTIARTTALNFRFRSVRIARGTIRRSGNAHTCAGMKYSSWKVRARTCKSRTCGHRREFAYLTTTSMERRVTSPGRFTAVVVVVTNRSKTLPAFSLSLRRAARHSRDTRYSRNLHSSI